MQAVLLLFLAAIPLGISLWALLDAARRPPWAWSLAGKSQVGWLGAIALGVFLLVLGLAISLWYLVLIRPVVAAIESGDLDRLTNTDPPEPT